MEAKIHAVIMQQKSGSNSQDSQKYEYRDFGTDLLRDRSRISMSANPPATCTKSISDGS